MVANADAVARRLRAAGWNGAKIEVIRNGFVSPGWSFGPVGGRGGSGDPAEPSPAADPAAAKPALTACDRGHLHSSRIGSHQTFAPPRRQRSWGASPAA